jgi:hypothetical protein
VLSVDFSGIPAENTAQYRVEERVVTEPEPHQVDPDREQPAPVPPPDIGIEEPDWDTLEQRYETEPGVIDGELSETGTAFPIEADPGDVAEQRRIVPYEDEPDESEGLP